MGHLQGLDVFFVFFLRVCWSKLRCRFGGPFFTFKIWSMDFDAHLRSTGRGRCLSDLGAGESMGK